jgi:hypothetical protein
MSRRNNKQLHNSRIDRSTVISLALIMLTTLGTTIPLYIQSTNQIAAIHTEITAIHQEMKDFHGRLCAIEERNKK